MSWSNKIGLGLGAALIWVCVMVLAGQAMAHDAVVQQCTGWYAQVRQGKLAPEVVFDPASECQLEGWQPS